MKIENDGFDLGAQRRAIRGNDLPGVSQKIADYMIHINNDKLSDFESDTVVLLVAKNTISGNGDYNLSSERYKTQKIKSSQNQWKKLGETVEFMTDGNWIESKDQAESGIRLIQTGNIGIGEYKDKDEKARFISEKTFHRLKCTEVFPGDVLISRLPDPVGRACQVPLLPTKMITAVDCTILRFNQSRIIPRLFVYYTKSEKYYERILPFLTGSSRSRISRKNLESVTIPVPPLTVQEEIVSELESYQKIIDGARQVVDNYKPRIDIDPEWKMVELGEVCRMKGGYAFKSSDYVTKGIQLLRMGNVKRMYFDIGNSPAFLPFEYKREYPDYIIRKGDSLNFNDRHYR